MTKCVESGSAVLATTWCSLQLLLQLLDLSLAELKLHLQGRYFSLQLLLV